ncbi:MAG: hypothetical protein WC565_01015 [Parcubacteria group bacterium]
MKELLWTRHSRFKMRQHSLSETRVRRVLNSPDRIERGIALKTIAMMRKEKAIKKEFEVWVMVSEDGPSRRIISAWRYPGVTRPGEPLPREVLVEMEEALTI